MRNISAIFKREMAAAWELPCVRSDISPPRSCRIHLPEENSPSLSAKVYVHCSHRGPGACKGGKKDGAGVKKFITPSNVVETAVGIVVAAAFGTIVKSFVEDIFMPPIGWLLGKVDVSNLYVVLREGTTAKPCASLAAARQAGAVTFNYGMFITTLINFLIIGFALFMVVKVVNAVRAKEEAPPAAPTAKECPACLSVIPLKATRCAYCGIVLK
ncbi:MAG: large conductance mechanosensitive channel protein MscL [Candidatus Oleimicrobiaceae bacterium]